MTGSSGGRWKDQPGQGVIVIGDGEPGAAMAAVLRRHRIGAGLTQDQLAGRAGLSVRTVRDIESGRVRAPRDRSLAALAAALGLSEAGRGELRSALAAVSATSDRAVSVGVLGPLSVTHGGRTIEVGRPLSRGLLGLLALRSGHPVSREEIIDVLWGECPPKTCNTLIHVQVARLRGRLEGPRTRHTNGRIVVLTGGGYLLDAGRVQVDLRQFDELASRARRALEEGSAEAACELFEQALRCWRGRVLADAGSRLRLHPDAVAAERRRMSTAIAYADNALGIGRHEQAAMRLHALASDEPLHEGLHARLMLALAGSGECAAALQVYAQIHRRLRDDLGIEPGDELRVAQQRVLRRQICEPDATAMPAHRPHRPAQLPAAPAAFVGRLDNLLALDGLLASPPEERPGVVLISGTAGVGKTALALYWAHRVADRFPDGQLHVNLRGFDPAGSAMSANDALHLFLNALGIQAERVPTDVDERIGLYRSLLARRRVLVMLDNALDAGQVRPLLPGSPHCLTLITSRTELTGLVATEAAHPTTLRPLSASEARELLVRRLQADRVAAEPIATEQIIARCARLPLALAIIAARAATQPRLPLATLAGQLGEAAGLDALTGEDPATDLRTVFSCSYRAVRPPAARMFRLLGMHPGPDIGTAAAASLAAVPAAQASRLLDELSRSHLIAETTPGRIGMHDLLRGYAAELVDLVDSDPERRAALVRMLDHYLHTGHRAALLLEPQRRPLSLAPAVQGVAVQHLADHHEALRWFGAEHPVLLAVLDRAAAAGFDLHTGRLAWTLTDFLQRQGRWHDQATIHRAALDAARRRSDLPAQARAHRHLGRAHTLLEDYSTAHTHYRHALRLAAQVGDLAGQAHTHLNLANTAERQGDNKLGLDHARRALLLFQQAGDRDGRARCLNTVGWFHARIGDHQRALTNCRLALTMLGRLGDRTGEAVTLHSLGYIHHQLGEYELAIRQYQRSVDLYGQLDDRPYRATAMCDLGEAHLAAGDALTARATWQAALDIFDDLNHPQAARLRSELHALDRALGSGAGSAC